jgi:nitroreductase
MPARVFAGPALQQPPDVSADDDNAVMLALGTESDDDLARLRAGEATSLVLLSATAMGLASCPVTEPLEIPETREAVRADVFGTSGHPQMLLRIGWAAVNADPLPVSPRCIPSPSACAAAGSPGCSAAARWCAPPTGSRP